MAGEVGSASVIITADTSVFRTELRAALADAGADAGRALDREIQRQLADTGRSAGQRIQREIENSLNRVRASIQVEANMTRLRAQIENGLRRLPPAEVAVNADTDLLRTQIETSLRGLSATVQTTTDTDALQTRVISELQNMQSVTISVTPDMLAFYTRLQAGAAVMPAINIPVDLDRNVLANALTNAITPGALDEGDRAGNALTRGLTNSTNRGVTRLASILRRGLTIATASAVGGLSGGLLGISASFGGLDRRIDGTNTRFSRLARTALIVIPALLLLNRTSNLAGTGLQRLGSLMSGLPGPFGAFAAQLTTTGDRLTFITRMFRTASSGASSLRSALTGIPGIGPQIDSGINSLQNLNNTTQRNIRQILALIAVFRLLVAAYRLIGRGAQGLFAILRRSTQAFAGLSIASSAGVAILGLAGAIASLITQASALVLVLGAGVGGALATIPAIAAGGIAAIGVLVAAFQGFGEALGAENTEDFNAAIADMTPAAQEAARSLRGLIQGPLAELQDTIQQSFFEQFTTEFEDLGRVIGEGTFDAGLQSISAALGETSASFVELFSTAEGAESLNQIFSGTGEALGGLPAALSSVTQGFLDFAGVISTTFGERLGGQINNLGLALGNWLSAAADSGAAVSWVGTAIRVFTSLSTIIQNVGSILQSVFAGAEETGFGFLGAIERITGEIAGIAQSEEGISTITNVFTTLATVAGQLAPIFTALLGVIGALAPAVASIAGTLGPVLAGVITSLTPVIEVIANSLADVAPMVGEVVSAIAEALGGLGPAIGPLLQAVGEGLAQLAPAFGPLGDVISAVAQAITPLMPVIGELIATLVGGLAPVLQLVVEALQPIIEALADALAPILPPLGAAFQQVAVALQPLLEALGEGLAQALAEILPPILQLVPLLIEQLMPAFSQLLAAITPLIPLLLQLLLVGFVPLQAMLPSLVELFVAIVEAIVPLVEILVPLIGFILQIYTGLTQWLSLTILVPVINGIVTALTGLADILGWLLGIVRDVLGGIIGFFQDLYNQLVGNSIIPDLVNGIIYWITQLPGAVLGIIGDLVSSAISAFTGMVTDIIEAVSGFGADLAEQFNVWPAVSGAVEGLISDIAGAFSGLGQAILDSIGDIGSLLSDAVGSAYSGIDSALGGILPGGAADGAIITRHQVIQVGEGNLPEVIIPLTKPDRARQLAEQSGLMRILNGGGGRTVNAPMTVNLHSNASQADVLASMFAGELTRRLGTVL